MDNHYIDGHQDGKGPMDNHYIDGHEDYKDTPKNGSHPIEDHHIDHPNDTRHTLDAAWRAELHESMSVIASLRQAAALKTELGGSRKLLAAFRLAETSESAALQRLLERLQTAVPLTSLLTAVLERNASSTVRDVGGIVERVFGALRGDEKKLTAFTRIFRRDLARTEQVKRSRMKRPVKGLFADCCVCGGKMDGETAVVFSCGHVAHQHCNRGKCALCAQTDSLHTVGVSLSLHRRHSDWSDSRSTGLAKRSYRRKRNPRGNAGDGGAKQLRRARKVSCPRRRENWRRRSSRGCCRRRCVWRRRCDWRRRRV